MENFIGEIRIFAGNYAPEGWALCNGQTLPINGNEALYTLIGVTYGGDGRTTFAVPNLQCRLAVGQGQGPSLSQYSLASTGGVETVALTQGNLPVHTHPVFASATSGTAASPGNNLPAQATDGFSFYASTNVAGFTSVNMDPNMLSPAGVGAAHSNMMPSMALSYIIATTGTFPPQN